MLNYKMNNIIGISCMVIFFTACAPKLVKKEANTTTPEYFKGGGADSTANTGTVKWQDYFTDSILVALIDTALKNNRELNIMTQEISIANNEIRARKGEYLPFLNAGAAAGVEKAGRYTRDGAVDENVEMQPGKRIPEPLPNYMVGVNASWEVDIWKKLRNAKKAVALRYLSTVEGRNFMVTNLVAEIASSYYQLMALDNQLEIMKQNIAIQTDALRIVELQKQAGAVTELAVRKFQAEVYKNRSRLYYIEQEIIQTENRINFLVGRYSQHVDRDSDNFSSLVPDSVYAGIPAQLLENRPDVREAEYNLAASKLDIKSAKANFYPSLRLSAGAGFEAFNPNFIVTSPESMALMLAGEMVAPLVNRNAIKATYLSANSRQIQAAYEYEKTILNAYTEVVNQLAMLKNLEKSYDLKEQQVDALNESIKISTGLFKSARADYMEVLMTQRDAVEAKIELIETKKHQMEAMVNTYKALGGGWK